MPEKAHIVLDTNVLVSRLLSRHSVAAQAVRHAMSTSQILISRETMDELDTVLSRPKFSPYLTFADRVHFMRLLERTSVLLPQIHPLSICRDPKDDKFLALALAGQASLILSGDLDLLTLHPFRGVAILSPRQYLDRLTPAQ